MANNKFDLQAFFSNIEGKTWSLGSAFKRADALPLDLYSVWETKAEAEEYAAEHPTAYPGQTLIVVEKEGEGEAAVDKIKLYYIDENRELQEVGSATLGDDETIVLDPETKKLSIKGFVDAQPETRLIKNKNGQLEWTADTQSAITGDISDLKSGLEDVEGRVDAVEDAIEGLGDIVNFAGVVADIANVTANDYEPGDIVIEKKTTGEKTVITEYICSKKSETENEWVSLGDPEGVVALQARMDAAEDKISNLESGLSDLTDYVGTIPIDESIESTNVVDYAEEVAADALDAAKTYADGKVQALAEGAVAKNTGDISTINGTITTISSDIQNLKDNKLDTQTFNDYKSTNDAAVANKLGKTEAEGIYLKIDDAKNEYYTNTKGTGLESRIGVVEGIVNDATNNGTGNAKLRADLNALAGTVGTNTTTINKHTEDIAANLEAIGAQGQAIVALQTKDTEHSSAIETANTNITANKTAIENIYKETKTTNAEGQEVIEHSGLLVNEIERAKAAEAKNAEDLGKETKRATEAEAALAEQIEGLESADGAQDDLIAKLREDVDAINETTIPTLETKSDAEAKLKAAKDYADEKITEVNSEIDDIQKEIGSLANVMHFAGILANGGDYEITSIVVNDATENADEGLTVVSNKSFDKGDVGIYEQKEYVCITIDDATEDSVFTSTWTAIGDVGATSALIEGLENSKLDKTEFETYKTETLTPKFNAIDQAITDANSAIAGEKERAEGIEEGLANRLTAVETKANTNETNIATNVTNIAANAKAIEDLDTELTSYIEGLLEWGSF